MQGILLSASSFTVSKVLTKTLKELLQRLKHAYDPCGAH